MEPTGKKKRHDDMNTLQKRYAEQSDEYKKLLEKCEEYRKTASILDYQRKEITEVFQEQKIEVIELKRALEKHQTLLNDLRPMRTMFETLETEVRQSRKTVEILRKRVDVLETEKAALQQEVEKRSMSCVASSYSHQKPVTVPVPEPVSTQIQPLAATPLISDRDAVLLSAQQWEQNKGKPITRDVLSDVLFWIYTKTGVSPTIARTYLSLNETLCAIPPPDTFFIETEQQKVTSAPSIKVKGTSGEELRVSPPESIAESEPVPINSEGETVFNIQIFAGKEYQFIMVGE